MLTAGQGQNPARQAHIKAGLAKEASAWSLNQVCGSGLRAVALGAQHIQLGDAGIVVAGGQESMSLSPHVAHLRAGQKMGDLSFIDSDDQGRALGRLQRLSHGPDGGKRRQPVADLAATCRTHSRWPARTRPKPRRRPASSRTRSSPFTVKTRKGDVAVDQDEYIRHGATMESMQKLRPAFAKDGSVTAANAVGPERRRGGGVC